MKLLRCLMATSLLVVAAIAAHAQFFTIQSDNDTSVLSRDPYAGEYKPHKDTAKVVQKQPAPKSVQEKPSKKYEKNFEDVTQKGSKMVVLSAICMTDSLLLSIIKKRLNVCMPISSIYTTSDYGYRKDPFKHCILFHDGIDLRCREEVVYNMLPEKWSAQVMMSTAMATTS